MNVVTGEQCLDVDKLSLVDGTAQVKAHGQSVVYQMVMAVIAETGP